jgi:uncharacterized protein (TIGR02271 family)
VFQNGNLIVAAALQTAGVGEAFCPCALKLKIAEPAHDFRRQQHTKILEMHLNLLRSTKFSQGVLGMADILNTSGTTAMAFFRKYSDALTAISELKDTGFTSSEIGLVTSGSSSELDYDQEDDIQRTSNDRNLRSANLESAEGIHTGTQRHSQDRGAWEKIKDFFTGEEESYRGDDTAYNSAFQHLSGSEDRARYYGSGLQAGGALVTVRADAARLERAREILSRNNGDLRTTGFENEKFETNRPAMNTGARANEGEHSLQLRGEVLRAMKERVQKGEIRLRKDVVTENQTINVPVTREEVIVERVDATGQTPVSGVIGDEKEIRIPVSEERVNVSKEQVVTGQVRVQKRTVQDTEKVSDKVQHEELRVEREGDVNVTDESTVSDQQKKISDQKKPIRKKPAA